MSSGVFGLTLYGQTDMASQQWAADRRRTTHEEESSGRTPHRTPVSRWVASSQNTRVSTSVS